MFIFTPCKSVTYVHIHNTFVLYDMWECTYYFQVWQVVKRCLWPAAAVDLAPKTRSSIVKKKKCISRAIWMSMLCKREKNNEEKKNRFWTLPKEVHQTMENPSAFVKIENKKRNKKWMNEQIYRYSHETKKKINLTGLNWLQQSMHRYTQQHTIDPFRRFLTWEFSIPAAG